MQREGSALVPGNHFDQKTLTNQIIDDLIKLADNSITEISLSRKYIKDVERLSVALSNYPQLKSLKLISIEMGLLELISLISCLPELEKLDIDSIMICSTPDDVVFLDRVPKLKYLNISDCHFNSDLLIKNLVHTPNLEVLVTERDFIKPERMGETLKLVPRLKVLNLMRVNLKDIGFLCDGLQYVPELEVLKFEYHQGDLTHFNKLNNLKKLTELNVSFLLSDNETENARRNVSSMNLSLGSLKKLAMYEHYIVPGLVDKFLSDSPNIEDLEYNTFRKGNTSELTRLIQLLPQLRNVRLSTGIKDLNPMKSMFHNAINLEKLDLSVNYISSLAPLINILDDTPCLSILDLGGCLDQKILEAHGFDFKVLGMILEKIPELKVLVLEGNRITDISDFEASVPQMECLEELNLDVNDINDPVALTSVVVNRFPNLRKLSLYHNKIRDVNDLKSIMPNLEILFSYEDDSEKY